MSPGWSKLGKRDGENRNLFLWQMWIIGTGHLSLLHHRVSMWRGTKTRMKLSSRDQTLREMNITCLLRRLLSLLLSSITVSFSLTKGTGCFILNYRKLGRLFLLSTFLLLKAVHKTWLLRSENLEERRCQGLLWATVVHWNEDGKLGGFKVSSLLLGDLTALPPDNTTWHFCKCWWFH